MTSFLKVKNNKIVWTKRDSKVTVLNFWEKSFDCESCGKETHLTSQACNMGLGLHHPVCPECYEELHAYHVVIAGSKLAYSTKAG